MTTVTSPSRGRTAARGRSRPAARAGTRPAARAGARPAGSPEIVSAGDHQVDPSLDDATAPPDDDRQVLVHGPHIKELGSVVGYSAVDWGPLDKVATLMREAARAHAIMLISGPVGVGKSFATGRGEEACRTDPSMPADIVWVELSTSVRGRALLAELYPQITGGLVPAPHASLQQMRLQLAEALSEGHRVLVVDEAQHVGREAMLVLRWLIDQPATKAALVLVGTPELWKTLAPEMRSRASYDIRLDAVADDEIAGVLRAYHPLFSGLDPNVLRFFNRSYARGRIRWWAHFLARAFHYAEIHGDLDKDLADLVVASMPRGA